MAQDPADDPTPVSTREAVDNLIHVTRHRADSVAIAMQQQPVTGAERTSAIIRAALESALANGLIYLVPEAALPEWVELDAELDLTTVCRYSTECRAPHDRHIPTCPMQAEDARPPAIGEDPS